MVDPDDLFDDEPEDLIAMLENGDAYMVDGEVYYCNEPD